MRKAQRTLFILSVALFLAGCTNSHGLIKIDNCSTPDAIPVAVSDSRGLIMRGTITLGAPSTGSNIFKVSNEKMTCVAEYNYSEGSLSETVPLVCNQNQKADLFISFADPNYRGKIDGQTGNGELRFDNGLKASFVFGHGIEGF